MPKQRSRNLDRRVESYILSNPMCSAEQVIRNCNPRPDREDFRGENRVSHSLDRLVEGGRIKQIDPKDGEGALFCAPDPPKPKADLKFLSRAEERRYHHQRRQADRLAEQQRFLDMDARIAERARLRETDPLEARRLDDLDAELNASRRAAAREKQRPLEAMAEEVTE